jgi:DNA-directed RNA polymerase sigma subunit (sigma70/sigma32)
VKPRVRVLSKEQQLWLYKLLFVTRPNNQKRRQFPDREVIVLRLRFRSGEPWSLQRVADILGVSSERVRQLEARAIRRLRIFGDTG